MAFTGCGTNETTSNGEYKGWCCTTPRRTSSTRCQQIRFCCYALKEKEGLSDKITFDRQSIQADQSNLNSIARRFVSDRKI